MGYFTPSNASNTYTEIPESVTKRMWDELNKDIFTFDGREYYVDKRYTSPYGYKYDFWNYSGLGNIMGRIDDNELVERLTTHYERNKKLYKILGNIE